MEVNEQQLDGRGRGRASQAKQRRLQALTLRLAGKTYQQIAQHLGYASASGAHKAVMTELGAQLREKAEEVRRLELARLDAITGQHFAGAARGDHRATLSLLRIMERRAKYLDLDNPRLHDSVQESVGLLQSIQLQLQAMPDTYTAVDHDSAGADDEQR